MRWSFPSNNNGDVNGISNSGVETFQGTPLKSLAREICQNSLDAALDENTVTVDFISFELSKEEIPGAEDLCDAFKRSLKFWEPKKAQDFFKAALDVMNTEKIPFLRISDYNTTGLCGSDGEYNTPWCNLTKSSGASDKAGTSGGSFGIGNMLRLHVRVSEQFSTALWTKMARAHIKGFHELPASEMIITK